VINKKIILTLLIACSLEISINGQPRRSDLEVDGLKGRVKSVRVETAKLSNSSGHSIEAKRELEYTNRYDEKGNLVEKLFRYEGTARHNRHLFVYDEKGNRLEKICREGIVSPPNWAELARAPMTNDGSTLFKTMIKYDDRGNRLEEQGSFAGQGPSLKQVHKYDASNRRIETATYRGNNTLVGKATYTYDADGHPAETLREKKDGGPLIVAEHLVFSAYELDATGNWTKRVISRISAKDAKAEPESVTYRRIGYY
jgi:hypothetical protein